MSTQVHISEADVWKALESVMDPEIPVLSIVDMGIITGFTISETDASVSIEMTPTFSGCPAIRLMEKQIVEAVEGMGVQASVRTSFDVAWSSNRISDKGREIIKNFGLAPPPKYEGSPDLNALRHTACPHCGSENTSMKTAFGPTLCRSLHYCFDCLQAFEQFKPV